MALTYQSSYMADSMMDFFVMMRGWMLISTTLGSERQDSVFKSFTRESYVDSMALHASNFSETREHTTMIDDFIASLRTVAPICQSNAELKYLSMMESISHKIKGSPLDGGYSPPNS